MSFASPGFPSPTSNVNDVHANASSTDPYKWSHGLTGVNQPMNYLFVNILLTTIILFALLVFLIRTSTAIQRDRRRITTITNPDCQNFWAANKYHWWGWAKEQLLYAPIWKTRHNREVQLSSAVSIGSLPTRVQLIVIIVYILSNLAYCLSISSDQSHASQVAEFRGRCGALAVYNLIFTVLFALRNNPFIWILHVSYDTMNLLHRWTARLVFVEALAHISAWIYNTCRTGGWHGVHWILSQSLSFRWGLTAFIAFCILVTHSIGPIRHAFYETFLSIHRLSIIVAMSGVYFHMAKHALPQMPWAYLFITLLIAEPVLRVVRILYYNVSIRRHRQWTEVTVEALPGEASRVTFSLPQNWSANPGSYVHVYLPRIALWSSHPFSVAWLSPRSRPDEKSELQCIEYSDKQLPVKVSELDPTSTGPTSVSCVIRARSGMTHALYHRANRAESSVLQMWGAIEGPYGGYHSLESYGTVVLFAAGVGITHQLQFVRHLLHGHNNGTASVQRIVLLWSIRSEDMLEWINPWLREIEDIQNYLDVVRVRLYVSKSDRRGLPQGTQRVVGRCNPNDALDHEISNQIGAMVVTVCGPGAFSDSVRAAVRRRVGVRSIDFIEEAFTY